MLSTHVISFALSQFFGLYMLIVAIIMLGRVDYYRQLAQKMNSNSDTIVFAALIGLMLGMLLVGIHNIWIPNPVVIITLICWTILILSVLWLAMPERMVSLTKTVLLGKGYYILSMFMVIFGFIILSRGVYLYVTHKNNFLLIPAHIFTS